MKNNRVKALLVILNTLYQFIAIYALCYDAQPKGDDISSMIAILVASTLQVFVFVFVNSKNMASSAFE